MLIIYICITVCMCIYIYIYMLTRVMAHLGGNANDTAMPGASRVPLTGTLPGELSNAVDELAQLLAAASRHVADGVSERHAGDCVSAPPPRVQLNPGNRKRSRGDTESSRQS